MFYKKITFPYRTMNKEASNKKMFCFTSIMFDNKMLFVQTIYLICQLELFIVPFGNFQSQTRDP
jgi:hypothetical protein